MARSSILCLLLLLCAPLARAEDDVSPTPGAAAEALIAAKDPQALAALARRHDPDPWLVADALLARGRSAVAQAFADAGTGPRFKTLSAWLKTAAAAADLAADREAYAEAEALAAKGEPAAALERLGKAPAHPAHVVAVRIELLRARLQSDVRERGLAAEAFERAANSAEALGWQVAASEALNEAGRVRHDRSELKAALALQQRRLAQEETLQEPMGIGRAHFGVQWVLARLGRVVEMRVHRAHARRLAEASGDEEYLAKLMSDDGVEAFRSGHGKNAVDLFERAEERLGKIDPAGLPQRFRPDAALLAEARTTALSNAASVAMSIGAYKRGRDIARKAVAMARTVGRPDKLEEARAFHALLEGVLYTQDGRYLAALGQLERARGRYERLGMLDRHADVLRRIASVRELLGDPSTALENVEVALRILKETGAARALGRAHYEAGRVCGTLLRFDDALVHYEEALRLGREQRDTAFQVETLTAIGRLHLARTEFSRALQSLNEALRLHEESGTSPDGGGLWLAFSSFYSEIGNTERSLEFTDRAIAILEQSRDAGQLLSAKRQKARLLQYQRRHGEALALLREMLAAYQLRADRRSAVRTLQRISRVLLDQGDAKDWEEARRLQKKAIGFYVAAGDKSGEIDARILSARAQVWTGEEDAALDEATYALELAEDLGSLSHRASALDMLAQVHLRRREHKLAIQHALASVRLLGDYGLNLAEEERASVRGVYSRVTRFGLAAALTVGDNTAAYELMERSRATALAASLGGRAALREVQVPPALLREEEAANGAAAMAYEEYQLTRAGGKLSATKARLLTLQMARRRQQDAVAAIQRAARSQVDLTYVRPAPLAEVQETLRADDALILYGYSGWRYLAQVITRTEARLVVLSEPHALTKTLHRLREDPSSSAAAAAARAVLLEPLALKGAVRRLLISPAQGLGQVPFGLLDPARAICFVPSATTLHLLRSMSVVPGEKVLALGDPSYSDRPPPTESQAAVLRGHGLAPLPATRDEAKAVGDVVLLGREASETKFREVMASRPRWRAVHLACHGLVDHSLPSRSALVLTHDARNDGFVHAGELFAQVPVPADLVVLSACETAGGREYRGEGLVGLTRAFMLSGTPRVLASLWRVDDEATLALMVKFYELWNPRTKYGSPGRVGGSKRSKETDGSRGLDAAAALRKAQEHVRTHPEHPEWSDPTYWAAWVLWGLPD